MNDETKKLLSSTYNVVLKKEKERQQNQDEIINKFYERAKNNSQQFNIEIIKNIIDDYLKWKEDNICNCEINNNPLFFIDSSSNVEKYQLCQPKIISSNSYMPDEQLSREDKKAIDAMQYRKIKNTSINSNDILVFQFKDNRYQPRFLYKGFFEELGFTINFGISLPDCKTLKLIANMAIVENLVKKIINDQLGNTIKLDDKYINNLKKHFKKLIKMNDAITSFKYESVSNSELIALNIFKKFINQYKNSPAGLFSDKTIHVKMQCYSDIEKIKILLDKDDSSILNDFLNYFTNVLYNPTILAIPYESGDTIKFLPMLKEDFWRALYQLSASYSTYDYSDKIDVYIKEDSLESLILKIKDSESKEKEKKQ